MNVACPTVCTEAPFALAPAVLAAVVTAVFLLAHWLVSFPSDHNRSS